MSLGIFDSKPKVKWLRGQEVDALVYLPGRRYVKVRFDASIDAIWIADSFGVESITSREVRFTDEGGSYDRTTNAGHPLHAIMGVAQATVEYLRRHEPGMLMFSAKGKRARIYEALMRRMPTPAGYRIYKEDSSENAYFIIRTPFRRKPAHHLLPFK